eukprot:8940232-Pyramimonas_sp.AAC.1
MQHRCSSEGFSSVGHPCWNRFGTLLERSDIVLGPIGTICRTASGLFQQPLRPPGPGTRRPCKNAGKMRP